MIKVIIGFAIIALITLLLYVLFPVVRVCGTSMFPTLHDGDIHIGRRVIRKSKCKIGDIYVLRPPYLSEEEKFVIKRLTDIDKGKYFFEGDNPDESYDSRYYGYVNSRNVVAHIVLKEKRCK